MSIKECSILSGYPGRVISPSGIFFIEIFQRAFFAGVLDHLSGPSPRLGLPRPPPSRPFPGRAWAPQEGEGGDAGNIGRFLTKAAAERLMESDGPRTGSDKGLGGLTN